MGTGRARVTVFPCLDRACRSAGRSPTWVRALRSLSSTLIMSSNGPTVLTRRRPSIDIVDAKVAVDLATAQTYSENVFLFVPNLIGQSIFHHSSSLLMNSHLRRLLSCHTRSSVAALHEPSSEVLYIVVRYLLFTGRGRWACRKIVGSGLEVWSCVGHGY